MSEGISNAPAPMPIQSAAFVMSLDPRADLVIPGDGPVALLDGAEEALAAGFAVLILADNERVVHRARGLSRCWGWCRLDRDNLRTANAPG